MKLSHLSAAVVFAVATLSMPAHAEPQAVSASADAVSARHAQDLRDLMVAIRIFKSFQRNPKNWAEMSGPDRELDTALRRQMTEEETYRRLTPGYAAVINAKQAADIARVTRSPAWRKREARLQDLNGASVYLNTFMTAAEITEARRADLHPAMAAFMGHRKSLHQKNQDALDSWAREFAREQDIKLANVLRKVQSDLAANRAAGTSGTITIGRVGIPYMDKMAYVSGSGYIRLDNAYHRFEVKLKNLGFQDILKSEYLVSKISVAHSRTVVEETEAALETLLKEVDLAIKERTDEMSKLELPKQAESVRKLETVTASAYGFMVDFGEHYRRLLDDHRRLLAFVSERSGKMEFKDGQLLFSSDADLKMALELFAKLEATRGELNGMIDAQLAKEVEAERRLRGERAAVVAGDKT